MGDVLGRIKIVMTDIDGVWTDGGMYYGPHGELMKRFNTRDGAGVALLRDAGIPTVIVTREDTDIVRARAKKLQIEECHCGVADKGTLVKEVCERLEVIPEDVAYIGDDIYDLAPLANVGFAACPSDAVDAVRQVADYVCQCRGGEGAFRELADLILQRQET